MTPAKTAAQRKAAERQRRAESGLTRLEVYAHPDDQEAIKTLAAKLQAKREKQKRRRGDAGENPNRQALEDA